jgi:hypothetical protein
VDAVGAVGAINEAINEADVGVGGGIPPIIRQSACGFPCRPTKSRVVGGRNDAKDDAKMIQGVVYCGVDRVEQGAQDMQMYIRSEKMQKTKNMKRTRQKVC